ncbi:MAG: DMT family transporter [Deltaproteobacteria bacterium]|nr:MAG: DMT family transporter [Deltaproteobacteria bacterium]
MLSGLFFSIGGVLVRLIETASELQIVFYRSVVLVVTMLAFMAARNKVSIPVGFRAVGATGVVGALCLALTFIGFITSLKHTTVANTLLLMSTASFMAAILSWIVLGERVSRGTWVAMIAATLGVAAMVSEGVAVGGLYGDLWALGAALAFACYTVALRRGKMIDMMPSVCLAGVFSALISGVIATAVEGSLTISGHDLFLCVILGAAQLSCGLIIFTFGSRHVPAAELILLALTEVVLAPIWVWLVVGEVPSRITFIGGGILLAAVTGQALSGMHRPRTPIGVV